jgi:hypothetical protein
MRLVVSDRGRIHRPDCTHRGTDRVWLWAEDKSRELVATAAVENGFGVCQHCRPFSLERDQQEAQR